MTTEAALPQVLPKKQRMRLARSELWMFAAVWAEQHRTAVMSEDSDELPFEAWPEDDPLVVIVETYALTKQDLGKLLNEIGTVMENKAQRAGY